MKGFSITSHLLMKEAERRGWKTKILNYENDFIALYSANLIQPILLRRATSELSTGIGLVIANDKMLTYCIATEIHVPMPKSLLYSSQCENQDRELSEFLHHYGRVVVKPVDCSGGSGVTTNITDEITLFAAINYAKKFSSNIIIQPFVTGDDYRILVLNGHAIAATWRRPPFVIGDGIHTIAQLIEVENNRRLSMKQEGKSLLEIDVNEVKDFIGVDQLKNIPEQDVEIRLLGVASVSRGGITCDMTESLHPSIFRLAEKITNACHLSLCGVDVLIDGDVSKPIGSDCQVTVIEINATPGLRMHHFPAIGGRGRNVAGAILDEILRQRCSLSQMEEDIGTDLNERFAELITDSEMYSSLSNGESEFLLTKKISMSN